MSFCLSYHNTGPAGFNNYVALVAMEEDVWATTINKRLPGSTQWQMMQELDYLWGTYSLGRSFSSHNMEHPQCSLRHPELWDCPDVLVGLGGHLY